MKPVFALLLCAGLFAMVGCATQTAVLPDMSSAERDAACQRARYERDWFCQNRAGTGYWFRDSKCWDALAHIKRYCD